MGIPKEDIVLGLHPPYKRPYTGYGVAWVDILAKHRLSVHIATVRKHLESILGKLGGQSRI
jgi:hypothetical protein